MHTVRGGKRKKNNFQIPTFSSSSSLPAASSLHSTFIFPSSSPPDAPLLLPSSSASSTASSGGFLQFRRRPSIPASSTSSNLSCLLVLPCTLPPDVQRYQNPSGSASHRRSSFDLALRCCICSKDIWAIGRGFNNQCFERQTFICQGILILGS